MADKPLPPDSGPDAPLDKVVVSLPTKMTAAQVAHMLGVDPSQVQAAPDDGNQRARDEAAETNRRALEANDIGRRHLKKEEEKATEEGREPAAVPPLPPAPPPGDNYTTDEKKAEKAEEAKEEAEAKKEDDEKTEAKPLHASARAPHQPHHKGKNK